MTTKTPQRIRTITEYHKLSGLPKPEHPLVSVINFDLIRGVRGDEPITYIFEFYSIALKWNFKGKIKYGQQDYDFDEGIMVFMSPGQRLRIEMENDQANKHSGWLLLFHPDFLWGTTLANAIKQYRFFDYAANEALFLSHKEEILVSGTMEHIRNEYHGNIDHLSQRIIIAHLELLLSYAERFYQRQFVTRKISNHQILNKLENLLGLYFDGEEIVEKGLPTVTMVADELHVSPGYLSDLLKSLTGSTTQQKIHEKLIEKAKEKLSTTDNSVSEIAYQLGFEHLQSFSKLFKSKTRLSPIAFRQKFN